jgi:dynein light chain 1, axonemal
MSTTIKEALKRWEERTGQTAVEAKVIELQLQFPPIQKMDNVLSTLVQCE